MKTIKRAILWFQIYALNITIAGMNECLGCVRDPMTLNRITISKSVARRELTQLQRDYNDTLPIERQVFWSLS